MAGPGIRIGGSGGGAGGGGPAREGVGELVDLFMKTLRTPSTANERLFEQAYRARVPDSSLFPKEGGGAGGSAMAGAAAQLYGAASQLNIAARALGQASAVLSAAGAGGRRGGAGGGSAGSGGGSGGRGGGNVVPGPWPGSGDMRRFAAGALSNGIMPSMLGLLRRVWPLAAIAEGIDLPRQVGAVEGSIMGASAPWVRLTRSTFARGMAGGFSGNRLRSALSPGTTAEPAWMRLLGVEPQEAADLLEQFGIPTRSAGGSMDLARLLSTYAASPAFANVGLGRLVQSVRQGQGLGIAPQAWLSKIAPTLDQAGKSQEDQTRILSSIEQILARIAAGGGAGMTLAGTLRFMSRFDGSGFAGARTGELQQQAAGSLGNVFSNLLRNPMALNIANMGLPPGVLSNSSAFRSFVGGDAYKRLMASPDTAHMVTDMLALGQQGNRALALDLFGNIIAANPNLEASIAKRGLGALLPPHLRGIGMSMFTGGNLSAAYALLQPPKSTGTGATPSFMEGFNILAGGAGFNASADYAAMLKRAGVPAALIPLFIKGGEAAGVSPVLSAAFAHAEHADWRTTGRGGLMGLTGVPMPPGLLAQIEKADQLIRGDLTRSGGDVGLARSMYVRGIHMSVLDRALDAALGAPGGASISDFLGRATGIGNLPLSVNAARSDVAQQQLSGAQVEFQTLGANLVYVNTAAHDVGKTFEEVAGKLRSTLLPTLDEINKQTKGYEQWQRDHARKR